MPIAHRGRATNAPLPPNIKADRLAGLTIQLKMEPELLLTISLPHFQPIFQKQLAVFLDGKNVNMTNQMIVDYWRSLRKRKLELEEELQNNISTMVELM